VQAVPEIPEQIARGEFHGLHSWLTENVYQHGRKFEPTDLIQRVTGQPMHSEPYVAYLNWKFGEIYGL
jgi:carboxypeptidase Taq